VRSLLPVTYMEFVPPTYLLGSNAATIVRHAKCSVLVIRR
jgi:hypothetical protein